MRAVRTIVHPTMRGEQKGRPQAHMTVSPNGAHRFHLHVQVGRHPIEYALTRQQVADLSALITAFEREAQAADDGPDILFDRYLRLKP